MVEIVATQMARDKMERQFADGPRRGPAPPAGEVAAEPRAPVRRTAVRFLRVVADRLEPAPRRVQRPRAPSARLRGSCAASRRCARP